MSNVDRLKLLLIVILLLFAVNYDGNFADGRDSLAAVSEKITDSVTSSPEARAVFGLNENDGRSV